MAQDQDQDQDQDKDQDQDQDQDQDKLLRRASAFGKGFFPLWAKKTFLGVCANFRPFLLFSSNLRNVE